MKLLYIYSLDGYDIIGDMMTINKRIGNNIKKIRLDRKYSIDELANMTNLDYEYLENIEKYGVDDDITLEILSRICSYLDINILDLFK